MKRVEKVWRLLEKFFWLCLPSAKAGTRQRLVNAECLVYCTRHYNIFAECPKLTLGEACFCRVLPSWHSANNNGNGRGKMGTFVATACAGHVTEFAECRLWGTRQRSICRVSPCRHSANKSSPHRNGRLRVGAVHVTVFTECQLAGTRQSVSLPSANWPALGKEIFRRVPVVRRVHVVWHSANSSFAECS